jgi:nitrite reductase/ring-hydroxylating ferredoxin subunit
MNPLADKPAVFDPQGLGLVKAGGLQRPIGASLERVWENVADWAHLPWLHSSNFSGAQVQDEGDWGWRITLQTGASTSIIELVMDKPKGHYVARTLEGGLKGMEIWTTLVSAGDHQTDIDVTFHVPAMRDETIDKIGAALVASYQTLWDEDEAMMVTRQAYLDGLAAGKPVGSRDLGPVQDLTSQLPMSIEFSGSVVQIVEHEGQLVAYAASCPHRGGPLEACAIDGGIITCPWHGYQFNIASGTSPNSALSLPGRFGLQVDEVTGRVTLSAGPA